MKDIETLYQDFINQYLIFNGILLIQLLIQQIKTISYQKRIIKEFVNASQSQPNETYQQLFRKSNENIDNFIKAFYAGNNYNFDTIDNTRENLKIYHKAIDTFNEYSTNAFDAWMSFAKSFYK